jgi:hypothetical protein
MLQGDFFTLGLPEVLQIIGGQRKTGMLTVVTADAENTIYFNKGNVILTQEQHDRYLLEKFFGQADPRADAKLKALLDERRSTGRPLGQLMVERGILKPEELKNELQRQTEEQLYSLFSWIDGAFNFIEMDAATAGAAAYEIDTVELVVNAAREVDEWRNIRARLPNMEAAVRAVAGGERGNLSEAAGGIADLITAEGITLKDLCASSTMSELDTCKIVAELLEARLVEIVSDSADAALQPSGGKNENGEAK